MSFHFRLSHVLEMKQQERDVAEATLGQIAEQVRALEDEIESLRLCYLDQRDKLNAAWFAANRGDAVLYERSLEKKKQQMMDSLRQLNERKQLYAQVEKLLKKLTRVTTGLQKLRERQEAEWQEKQERKLVEEVENRFTVRNWEARSRRSQV